MQPCPINDNAVPSDAFERQQALDPHQSFIVQAPAGSGKTELLIQRFLTLLTRVKQPEEILAITFTKKAANEMRNRVISALKNAHLLLPATNANSKITQQIAMDVLKRDKLFQWNLLLNPNRLQIQTIDALCVYLTKSLPLLSRFGAQPILTDFADQLYFDAVKTLLSHLEDDNLPWSTAIASLLLHVDNDLTKLSELLMTLLAKRDQWMQYIHLDLSNDEIKSKLEEHIAHVINEHLTTLRQFFPTATIKECLACINFAAHHNEKIASFTPLFQLPPATAAALAQWQMIANFFLTKQGEWRKRVDKDIGFPALKDISSVDEKEQHKIYREMYLALAHCLRENNRLLRLLQDTRRLPQPHYPMAEWEILKKLFIILKVATAQLRLTFQQHGKIDFIENAQAAIYALGDEDHPTDLLLALDYAIKHILVDEFQDTSSTQFHLLEKLISGWEDGDGRTLFVVGDPMQSIYRFREAEVGLFLRMRNAGIGKIKLTPLTLTVNFRSQSEIVNWNNECFGQIFPPYDNIASGAVSYKPSIAMNTSKQALVQLHGFMSGEEVAQEKAILHVILEEQNKNPNQDIAILVRSRSHLNSLIPLLKRENIPFKAIDIDALATRQHIQDLLSLTVGLLHLADRIAWLAILRAPWCGLTLNDLLVLAGSDPYAIIWHNLLNEDIIACLSEDGQNRIKKIMPILQDQLDNRQRLDIRTWIENIWYRLGGPATLTQQSEIKDANAFFELLSELEQIDLPIDIDFLKEKINYFYASNEQDEACRLQIMTIHSAKGLEFDTVIVPHLEKRITQDEKILLQWIEQPLGSHKTALLLAPIQAARINKNDSDTLYHYIHQQKLLKSDYEMDRLFYVATTRAKTSLHLFFDVEIGNNDRVKLPQRSFLAKLWPTLSKEFSENMIKQYHHKQLSAVMIDHEDKNKINVKRIKRFISDWQINELFLMPSQKIFSHRQESGFLFVENSRKVAGIVIHVVLQNLARSGVGWWHERSEQQKVLLIKRLLQQHRMMNPQLQDTTQLVMQVLQRCLADQRCQWILQPHQQHASEYAISAVIHKEIKNFIIDRTFIENDIRWIIDFKSSTLNQNDVDSFLMTEYVKYQEKMLAYHQAFKLIENRPIQLALYFPAIPAWKAWSVT